MSKSGEKKQIGVLIAPALITLADEIVAVVSAKVGVTLSRNQILCAAIEEGLKVLECKHRGAK